MIWANRSLDLITIDSAIYGSGGQSTQIKYLSKSTDTYNKSTAFSILLEWKYKSTKFFMYLSKKNTDRFI